MRELALFAGAGGGILGGKLLGWRTVCAVEIDPYARRVLLARQRDGCLASFPVWDDIRTFDGHPWRGHVDVVAGGFPCQDISAAGKGAGIEGERSGLWVEMARVIREVLPRFAFVENSPMLTSRGLGTVLGDLAEMGFDAQWGVLGAHNVGAPHKRDRIWIVAHSESVGGGTGLREGLPERDRDQFADGGGDVAYSPRLQQGWPEQRPERERAGAGGQSVDVADSGWWQSEPDVGRVADGVASRVDRLRCLGNGQVPAVAAAAWRILNPSNMGHAK